MIPSRLSQRYAKALLAIGVDSGQSEQIGEQLDEVAALWRTHRDLRPTLENPSHPLSRRRAILRDLSERLRLDAAVRSLLLLLLDRQRIQIIGAVARDYRTLVDLHAGRVRAQVTSARALDERSLHKLQSALEARTGKNVLISIEIDPELLAGTVTRIGSIVYDGSLNTRLEQLRQEMTRASS